MKDITKLKKIREIVYNAVGDNDTDGLVELLDLTLEKFGELTKEAPPVSPIEKLETRILNYLAEKANDKEEHTDDLDTLIKDTENIISEISAKVNPFEGKEGMEDSKKAWENDRIMVLNQFKYQLRLLVASAHSEV